jgi:hypothetical protein
MSAATAGVYTLTAYNAGGCPTTVYSNSVTVNPLPAAITASPNYLCVNSSVTVSDATPLGTWSATSTTVATVNVNTGVVKGVSPGNAVIKFTLPTSCFVTQSITIVAPPATITGSATVCQGQGTTLSIASIGGTWSSSNLTIATVMPTTLYTPTAVVTGASMGSVTITYAVGFDCYSVKSMTVYPRAEITGRDSVCKGNTTYLANIVGGGTWSSSNTSFVTIGSTDGFVTGVNTGISRITYSTPLGCLSTVSMTVIAFPAPITGTMHTCPGASTILRDATLNGTWSSDNNGVATVNPATGVVYGAFADTVTINYTVKPGCSVSALVLVNPNPAPITGTDSLCVLTADTLHDGTPSGVWSTSTSSIATIDTNGVLHATVGGNSVVSYTLPVTGCKATRTFTVNPLPVPIITYDHANATLHTDTFYKHYQWSGSIGGDIPGANSTSTAALYTMYYYVTVVDNHGCVGTSAPYYFDETLLNVGNVGASGIKVFPNPATESIYITSPVRVRAVVSGIDGRQQIDQADAKNIDISRLADGIYFVTLYNDDNHPIAIRKIVKQ